jgi:hypothetical protein
MPQKDVGCSSEKLNSFAPSFLSPPELEYTLKSSDRPSQSVSNQAKMIITLIYTTDKNKPISVIMHYLSTIEKVKVNDIKLALIIQLFDYIVTDGIDTINGTYKLKRDLINKCRTFKNEYPLLIDLVASCDRLLMALGEPLDDREKYDLECIALQQGLAPKENVLHDYYDSILCLQVRNITVMNR